MIKRIFISILVLSFLIPIAYSESWQAPALKNPQDAYEYYVEETDGSDQMIFGVIDIMNEEAAIAEEHGAVKFIMSFIGPDGTPMITTYNYLQKSEFGNVHIMETTNWGETSIVYNIGTKMYQLQEDTISVTDNGYTPEDADWIWNSYIFPFGNLEVLNGVRQDENGYTYFLIKSDDTMTFEYVVGDGMKIKQLRVYYSDGSGNHELAILVDYGVSEAQPLPQDLIDLLAQTAESAPSMNKSSNDA